MQDRNYKKWAPFNSVINGKYLMKIRHFTLLNHFKKNLQHSQKYCGKTWTIPNKAQHL